MHDTAVRAASAESEYATREDCADEGAAAETGDTSDGGTVITADTGIAYRY